MKKPPLGVIPVLLWKERRAVELIEAMTRYSAMLKLGDSEDAEAARDLIDQWARELVDLNLRRAMPF